jgi:hydrogenase nickel incorporation protein HypA/HybF
MKADGPMHEASIMTQALAIAEEHAKRSHATSIRRIGLRVGVLAGVVPDALHFAFAALRQGTMAADAELGIEEMPATFVCLDCGSISESISMAFVCPACGGTTRLDDGGRELELAFLEVTNDV